MRRSRSETPRAIAVRRARALADCSAWRGPQGRFVFYRSPSTVRPSFLQMEGRPANDTTALGTKELEPTLYSPHGTIVDAETYYAHLASGAWSWWK